MKKDNISKKINKRIILASFVYTIIFLIIFIIQNSFGLDHKQQLSQILLGFLVAIPYFFIGIYIISGTQVLILGFILKYYYRNNLNDFIKLSTTKSKLIIIILSVLWLILNFFVWNILNNLKLG